MQIFYGDVSVLNDEESLYLILAHFIKQMNMEHNKNLPWPEPSKENIVIIDHENNPIKIDHYPIIVPHNSLTWSGFWETVGYPIRLKPIFSENIDESLLMEEYANVHIWDKNYPIDSNLTTLEDPPSGVITLGLYTIPNPPDPIVVSIPGGFKSNYYPQEEIKGSNSYSDTHNPIKKGIKEIHLVDDEWVIYLSKGASVKIIHQS